MYVVVPEGMEWKDVSLYYISHINLHKLVFVVCVYFIYVNHLYLTWASEISILFA